MNEHQGLAPTEVVEVFGEVRLGVRGSEVIPFLLPGQSWIEALGVEIAHAHVVAGRSQSPNDSLEQHTVEGLGVRVGVHHEDPHDNVSMERRTRSRKARRLSGVRPSSV